MTKDLKVAVIGCGFFGQQLASGFSKANANLVGFTDINQELAQNLSAKYSSKIFNSTEDLLQQTDPDLVVIATPNYAHYSPSLLALNANCHLFIDTPFALNSAHCLYLLDLAEKKQKDIFVGHVLRTLPGMARVKKYIEDGFLGQITFARATRQRWISNTSNKEWWKLDSTLTGGELFHQIHELDLLCWLLGDVDYVYAQSANHIHLDTPDSQDIIQLLFRFKNGASGSLEMGTAYRLHDWGITIHGENGAISVNFYTSSITVTSLSGETEYFHLYDEFEADLSLRESAKGIQQYNATNGVCPFWLSRAVEIETQSVTNYLLNGVSTPLKNKPAHAIQVAEAAKHSMIIEKRIYL